MATINTKVAVLGGGPGGYAAAFHAADLGMDVTLIDLSENPGGVCLYRGCIPSKALLHIAKVIMETRESEEWGVKYSEPEIDLDKIRSWKNRVVEKLTGGVGQLAQLRDVKFIQGRGKFVGSNTIEVDTAENKDLVEFEHAILATGSHPVQVAALSVDSDRVMNSTVALNLPDIPDKLLVIGGGYIGLELGQVYYALGADVSVVEMMPTLLPGLDQDLLKVLSTKIQEQFTDVMLNSKVVEMKEQKNGMKVTIEQKDGETFNKIYDRVLVSIGRKPVTQGLGLENTGVRVLEDGFVRVNPDRSTDDPSIYAIGDIAGEPMLAHKASHEGMVAVDSIAGEKVVFEPYAIPAVVFTTPEVAWCGLTEIEAKEQGVEYEVAKFPWGASGRATTLGRNDGITKLLIDPGSERILGVGIVGVDAGELIAEGVLAIEMAATAADLKLTIHQHPTLSETVMEAAELYYGPSTHVYRPKK